MPPYSFSQTERDEPAASLGNPEQRRSDLQIVMGSGKLFFGFLYFVAVATSPNYQIVPQNPKQEGNNLAK